MTDFISIKEHRKLVSVDMVFAKFNTERRTGADPYWFSPFMEISKIIQNVNSGKATVRQGTYKKNLFQFEKLCIKTRFETEVTGTREWLILCFPGQSRPIRQLRSLSQENVELKLTEYAKHAEPSKF